MSDGWELLASWPGGAVPALATGGGSLTLAATPAGLHVTEDGGQSWRWVGLGPAPVPEALAVSSTFARDRTALLGTASGLFRSGDGGASWRPVLVGSRIQCLAATLDFADVGVVLAGTESDGVLRSEDGGLSWDGASAGLLDLDVTSLALSPSFSTDRTALAGTASGLYRSRNGGRAWRLVELGPEAPVVQALAFSPAYEDDGVALAGTESDGLFRSDDGGQTWEPVASFPKPCVTALACGRAADGASVVVAGTAVGVVVSRNGGVNWTTEGEELGPILCVTLVPAGVSDRSAAAILAGTIDGGVMRRELAAPPAETGWSTANRGLAGRATVGLSVLATAGRAPVIAVASLDAGVLVSSDGGANWQTGADGLSGLAASSVALVRSGATAPRSQGPLASTAPRLLASFSDGLYRSDDLGTLWTRVERLDDVPGTPAAIGSDETVGDMPSALVTAGRGHLALSLDGGASWRDLPLPPDRPDLASAFVSPDVARDGTVHTVARVTQVARDGSLEPAGLELWHTDTLGARWTCWLESPSATVMPVVVPRAGDLDTSLLVGHAGRVSWPLRNAQQVRRGERRPLWQDAQLGEPGSAVTALALSPQARTDRTVIAASDRAVYLSRDGGTTFAPWDQGLSVPLVTGLALVSGDGDTVTAYALGLGGSLWRRQL